MTPEKYNFYRNVAQNYKASILSSKSRAVIHLENKNDEAFWRKVLKMACPDDKFYFVPFTRTLSANKGEGCKQCLVYKDFLDDKLCIAIDSDLHRFLQDIPEMDASPYIFQTYTYSFENHLCFAERLNSVLKLISVDSRAMFDFEKFLESYSKEIYPLFLLFLYDNRQSVPCLTHHEFNKLLNFKNVKDKLVNNGVDIISELHRRVNSEIIRLKNIYPEYDQEKEAYQMEILTGLYDLNTYLYVRGHNLFNLIVEIGDAVCYNLKMQKKKSLSGNNRKSELTELFDSRNSFTVKMKEADLSVDFWEIHQCLVDIKSVWFIK